MRRGPLASEGGTEDTDVLWRALRKTGCPQARERLILHYFPLVKFVAARVGAGVPGSVEFDDLVSYGTIGLIEAVDRFDLKRKVKFETYAVSRIRGAMLDEMRALDWVPRSVRAKMRQLENAKSKLRADLLREPTGVEIANEVGCFTRELRESHTGSTMAIVALEELVALGGGEEGEHVTVLDTIVDTSVDEPGAGAERDETRCVVLEALVDLGEREQTMISLYYFGDKTLSHIGATFGVTESRVSQIHTRALRDLSRSERVREMADSYGWTPCDGPGDATIQQLFDERIAALPARQTA